MQRDQQTQVAALALIDEAFRRYDAMTWVQIKDKPAARADLLAQVDVAMRVRTALRAIIAGESFEAWKLTKLK